MPYILIQEDIDKTTGLELAFGTTRCLPKEDTIPPEFYGPFKGYGTGNVYFRMADALFCGSERPDGDVVFNPGFRADGPAMMKFLAAHLKSFEPRHEHKMAGLAYMISLITTIKEQTSEPT